MSINLNTKEGTTSLLAPGKKSWRVLRIISAATWLVSILATIAVPADAAPLRRRRV